MSVDTEHRSWCASLMHGMGYGPCDCGADLAAAVPALLRLRAENERLKAKLVDANRMCDSYAEENQQFHDEIERLRAALGEKG